MRQMRRVTNQPWIEFRDPLYIQFEDEFKIEHKYFRLEWAVGGLQFGSIKELRMRVTSSRLTLREQFGFARSSGNASMINS